ncbi:hypothetical protein QBC47DRAFT_304817 [Echria macrotheca]|uniref:SMP domain-containing protein n=1 Tax=Echria macrotheca TaxID=438768 RepID=A0AAJ0F999_9PEZI|nr:hypothetical protein QBC47DRAFT_304817 [Echria macrotheca]
MTSLPSKDELVARAAEGLPITQEEASKIAAAESDLTNRGPIKGGTAAVAQSLHDRQMKFLEKANEVVRKADDKITRQDAAEVQSKEAKLGGPPGKGSTSAQVQSIADRNAGNA